MTSKKKASKTEARESRSVSELVDKIELERESVDLNTRLVSGRNYPIESIRDKAKVKVALLPGQDKYAVKLYRGNVLVAQELVVKHDYSAEQVESAYRSDIVAGNYDRHLTEGYQERKALRGKS